MNCLILVTLSGGPKEDVLYVNLNGELKQTVFTMISQYIEQSNSIDMALFVIRLHDIQSAIVLSIIDHPVVVDGILMFIV